MWIADGWKDYELLDCGGGEKLERWGDQILVRPDPQAIWESDRKNRGWRTANARYSRSSTGGGHWDKNKLPESWPISYKSLRFQVKPMNFKHTGLAAAGSAGSGEELPGAAGGVLASVAAGLAALGLVLEAALSIELLLTGGEHELLTALLANQSLVFVHDFTLSLR